MKDINPSKRALCAVLVICMTFFTGSLAFAENNAMASSRQQTVEKMSPNNHKQFLEEAVIKLMEEGKLTKEKAEKILEYKKKKADELSKLPEQKKIQMKKQRNKGSLLKDLEQEGIITEAEAQAIRTKLYEMKEARLADGMQGLVDKGVLTTNDIEKIRSYMVKVREERKEQLEKLKTMTPEEREEYFKNAKKDRKDIITRMVEDNVITKNQAEEIKKAIPELNKSRHKN
ncbi:MAG: hypothetical protein APF77_13025 [Clostridia bacterium BRH_c25]|nr:MAG: hypothetical protein APF77_13025 [Clostridia bacterium BRH_c25]